MWSLIGTLLVLLVVLSLTYLFTRYLAGRLYGGGSAVRSERRLTVVEQLLTGRDQKLLLVRLGDHYMLLGATQERITCLKELTEEETESWRQETAATVGTRSSLSFQKSLRDLLEQKKR